MLDCISVANMRDSDAWTIANRFPSLELMYRAAMGVYKAYDWQGRTAIVVGSGNNGGDGYALAWILRGKGIESTVFTLSDRLSQDSGYYAEKAREAGVPIQPFQPDSLAGYDTIVDCLLGTGFQGEVRDSYRAAIGAINTSPAFTISVDINSGMNGDTGAGEWVVDSDLTVTIGYVKRGLVMPRAGAHIRRLVCVPIGIELVRKEWVLCADSEGPMADSLAVPEWLDMEEIL